MSIQVIVAKTRQKYNSKFKTLHRPSFIFSIMLQTSEKGKINFLNVSDGHIRSSMLLWQFEVNEIKHIQKSLMFLNNLLAVLCSKFRPIVCKYWLGQAQFFSIPLDRLSKTRLENVPRLSKGEAKSRSARFGILP